MDAFFVGSMQTYKCRIAAGLKPRVKARPRNVKFVRPGQRGPWSVRLCSGYTLGLAPVAQVLCECQDICSPSPNVDMYSYAWEGGKGLQVSTAWIVVSGDSRMCHASLTALVATCKASVMLMSLMRFAPLQPCFALPGLLSSQALVTATRRYSPPFDHIILVEK